MKVDQTSRPEIEQKTIGGLAANQTVASLARPVEPLRFESSLSHAVETLRQSNIDPYPVVSGSRLVVLLSKADLGRALLDRPDLDRDTYRLMPLSTFLYSLMPTDYGAPTLSASDPVTAAFALFRDSPDLSTVGVTGSDGKYFGVLSRTDLLAGTFRTLAPGRVGGMATPLGVYLTDGINSGGVGNLALLLAGATLTSLFFFALVGTNFLEDRLLENHVDLWGSLLRVVFPIMPQYAAAFVDDVKSIVPIFVMLLLLRIIPVAGYHAAEHQVVHTIEHGEPLVPEIVALMPRPHPRCGTNLVAAVLLFGVFFSFFSGILESSSAALVPAAIITLLTWREVGTFLQLYFTTRKASLKQLKSGIFAGEQLLSKYRANTNRAIKPVMRVWRMGFIQMLTGSALLGGLLYLLSLYFQQLRPYLQSIY